MRSHPTVIALLWTSAVGATGLTAQEDLAALRGCYDVAEGEWVLGEEPPAYQEPSPDDQFPAALGKDSAFYQIPPRIEFAGPVIRGRRLGRFWWPRKRITVPAGALPTPHPLMTATLTNDTLWTSFGDGFFGVTAVLQRSGDGWVGIAGTFSDNLPYRGHSRPVAFTPVSCESPPPVSIDVMEPVARSVEIEGGPPISLGEALPIALRTRPRPSGALTVVGRTAGIFAGADSIAVRTNPTLGVVSAVQLVYLGADDHETLRIRFHGAFGVPDINEAVGDTPVPGYISWMNRITDLNLMDFAAQGVPARVLLEDRRYRRW